MNIRPDLKRISALAALILPLAAVAAGDNDDVFVSPSEPHGVVTTINERPGAELYGVRITEVNGQLVGGPRANAVWLRPGTHTIQARGAVVQRGFTGGTRRNIDQLRDADLDRVSINVEAGKTYYLALDTSADDPLDWKIVIHRITD